MSSQGSFSSSSSMDGSPLSFSKPFDSLLNSGSTTFTRTQQGMAFNTAQSSLLSSSHSSAFSSSRTMTMSSTMTRTMSSTQSTSTSISRDSSTDSCSIHSDEGINDSVTNFSEFTTSVYGYMGQAASGTWGLMKTVVSGAVSTGISLWYGEGTPPVEWHCDSEDEEEQKEEAVKAIGAFSKPALTYPVKEEKPKTPRTYLICNELVTTEKAYVNRLQILVEVKDRISKILQPDITKAMFQNVEVICKFHKENLLPELEERLSNWEERQCIGDIMRKLVPFLKLYTEYVMNFEKANQLVEQWGQKSSAFGALLREMQNSKEYGFLRLQAYMLEPIQRVPRYELLLKDYLKWLPGDSPDGPDAEKAMQLVSETAAHFEDMMKRDSRITTLLQVQRELDGPVNVVGSNRELIKRGKILKISVRSGKSSDKYAFLFSDMMLLCNEPGLSSARYKVRHVFELENATVTYGNNLDLPNTFYIKSTKHALELGAKSSEEREEWVTILQRQLGICTKSKLMRHAPPKTDRDTKPCEEVNTFGEEAPVYTRMSDVSMCMLCGANFKALKRKQHCRACGAVVCARCSPHQLKLAYDPRRAQRVCDQCFVVDQEGPHHKLTPKGKTEGECLEKAYLQLSSDGGKTWKGRYFSIHDSNTLYSFKAPQDINPLTSLSLHGSKASVRPMVIQGKEQQVLEIKVMGKVYFLLEDNVDTLHRWQRTLAEFESSQSSSLSSQDSFNFDNQSIDSASIDSASLNSQYIDTPDIATLNIDDIGGRSNQGS